MSRNNADRLTEAYAALHSNPQFEPLIDSFREERERCRTLLETQQDSALVKVLQGRAQAFGEIIDHAEKCHRELHR